MKTLSKAIATISLLLFFAQSGNAALIVNNSFQVDTLTLNEDFESFYARGVGTQFSSNTGLEIVDSIVLFFAEYQGVTALFGLLDVATIDNQPAELGLTIDDNSNSAGGLIFLDDNDQEFAVSTGPNEIFINFGWSKSPSRNDGFIYGVDDENDFDIDFIFDFINGTPEEIVFLSFDEQNTPDSTRLGAANIINVSSSISKVSAPGTLILMVLGVTLLLMKRKRAF